MSGRHNGTVFAMCHTLQNVMDLQISELLGSFGDNELSPECLDGAQRFLKDDGINIPVSYTALIAPVQTSRLWQVPLPPSVTALFCFGIQVVFYPFMRKYGFNNCRTLKALRRLMHGKRRTSSLLFFFRFFGYQSSLALTHLQICCKDERKETSCL